MAKKESNVVVEEVYSPVHDTKIKSDISGSEIWKSCYKKEEVTTEVLNKHPRMYKYTIKFDGLTPFQVTKVDIVQ